VKTIVVDNGDCNCNYCQKKKLQNSVGFFSDRASAVDPRPSEKNSPPVPGNSAEGAEEMPTGLLPAPAITTLRARVMTDYSGVISIQCPRPDCGEPVEFPGSDWPELGELLALLRVHEASKHVVVLDSGALDKLREALQVHVNREQR